MKILTFDEIREVLTLFADFRRMEKEQGKRGFSFDSLLSYWSNKKPVLLLLIWGRNKPSHRNCIEMTPKSIQK